MNYKIIINADNGGNDNGVIANGVIEKDYNLLISNYIHNRLDELGIPNSVIRSTNETLSETDRINRIENTYGKNDNIIVITNSINSNVDGAEIIYPLRNNDKLPKLLASQLENSGLNVIKYYQQRLESNPIKDANSLIRNTDGIQTIIIEYGNLYNGGEANYIKNNWEKIGEAIVIALADYINANYISKETSKYYVVQKGDSLYKIANEFNLNVNELKKANNLSSNLLSIGQVLIIPEKIEMVDTNYINYKVVKGDSLYKIANKFNTTVDQIKALNNLSSILLSIEQILKIPTNNNYQTYIVVKGDSLYKIATTFNTTVNQIKLLNNLSSNLLSIGQILKIPR